MATQQDDVAAIRSWSRLLSGQHARINAVLVAVTNQVVGGGFSIEIDSDLPPAVINKFLWTVHSVPLLSSLSRQNDVVYKSRRDGEVVFRFLLREDRTVAVATLDPNDATDDGSVVRFGSSLPDVYPHLESDRTRLMELLRNGGCASQDVEDIAMRSLLLRWNLSPNLISGDRPMSKEKDGPFLAAVARRRLQYTKLFARLARVIVQLKCNAGQFFADSRLWSWEQLEHQVKITCS